MYQIVYCGRPYAEHITDICEAVTLAVAIHRSSNVAHRIDVYKDTEKAKIPVLILDFSDEPGV